MIKNNYQRVLDLHQIHLINKVRVVRHAINKVVKKSLQNINHVKYLHLSNRLFDLTRSNRKYLTGKKKKKTIGCHIYKK